MPESDKAVAKVPPFIVGKLVISKFVNQPFVTRFVVSAIEPVIVIEPKPKASPPLVIIPSVVKLVT